MADQYYTKRDVAEHLILLTEMILAVSDEWGDDTVWVEPSAGEGAFFHAFPDRYEKIGMDIAETRGAIRQQDYLTWSGLELPSNTDKVVVVGNPPFGKRYKTAMDFIWKSAGIASSVAFVLPIAFQRYSLHKKMPGGFKLVSDIQLEPDSFITPKGKEYSINTAFQIWTRLGDVKGPDGDMRLYSKPAISHPDFTFYWYNATKEAEKWFDKDWDFAVPCWGFNDYDRRETCAACCEKQKHWMLFKPHTDEAAMILSVGLDFGKLASTIGTIVPGFCKSDVVAAYSDFKEWYAGHKAWCEFKLSEREGRP